MSIEKLPIIDHFKDIDDFYWKYYGKYGKIKYEEILDIVSKDSLNIDEVCNMNWHLERKYELMLSQLLNDRALTITDFCNRIIVGYRNLSEKEKDKTYKRMERDVEVLCKLKLITESSVYQKKNLGTDYFSYELSLNGIFYCIINSHNSPELTIRHQLIIVSLLRNYPDNALFNIFLYPYFETNTLNENAVALFVDIIPYLSEICKIIIKSIHKLDTMKDMLIEGYWPENLFDWPLTYPEDKVRYDRFFSTNGQLAKYLSKKLVLNWTKRDEILPKYDEDLITIRNNHLKSDTYIRISRSQNTVYLKYGENKLFFKLTRPNTENFVIYGKSDEIYKDSLNKEIKEQSESKLVELIYKIRTRRLENSPTNIMLNKDEKFRKIVKVIVEKIDLK